MLTRRDMVILGSTALVTGCSLPESMADGFAAAGDTEGFSSELDGVVDARWPATGLSGQGVRIGVIDAGFGGFSDNRFTRTLSVEQFRSFVPMTGETFSTDPDGHGTEVTQFIGGRDNEQVRGLAHNSTYILAKGEEQSSERRSDEFGVIDALDWLASLNIKLINISLGYTSFDDESPYTPASMDGQTAAVTRKVSAMLAEDPELIIVASAGNQGRTDWGIVTAPGDAQHAITVGAGSSGGTRRRSSTGLGNDQVAFIKPDFVTNSGRGASSVATATITGLVACLREAAPNADRQQILAALQSAGSNRAATNREIGFGTPDAMTALETINRRENGAL